MFVDKELQTVTVALENARPASSVLVRLFTSTVADDERSSVAGAGFRSCFID